jgi:hypothetical protein
MPRQKTKSFRLGQEYDAKLECIARERRWTETETVRAALDALDGPPAPAPAPAPPPAPRRRSGIDRPAAPR